MRWCLIPMVLAAAGCTGPETRNGTSGEPVVVSSPTTTPAAEPIVAERKKAEDEANDVCGARKVAPWIGKDSTVPVRSAVANAAGAASDRWLYPDSVVTQDFRPDRLIVVMEKGTDRIVSAHCG